MVRYLFAPEIHLDYFQIKDELHLIHYKLNQQ
jgi:hypothetical protein